METTLTQELKDTCLYIHTRKSDGRIFYAGIGSEKRPYSKLNRNKYWRNTVKAHGGFDVTILKTGLTWKEACDLEIKMIAFYGRVIPDPKNPNCGCLVNMTDGGDGTKGFIPGKEIRKKMSEKHKGEKNAFFGKTHSEESRKKISKKRIGKYGGENHPMFGSNRSGEKNPMFGKTHSEETRKKLSDSHKGLQSGEKNPMFGKTHSEETRKKISENLSDRSGEKNPMFGKTHSEETRKKISKNTPRLLGENNPMFGKNHNEETRKKMRENNSRSKKVICSVTNKIYNTIGEAAKDKGLSYSTLYDYLKSGTPNKTSLRYL